MGNQRHCNGRLVHGPDRGRYRFAMVVLLLPAAPFAIFVSWELHLVTFIIGIILFAWSIVLYFITSYADPGVIPRTPHLKEIPQDPYFVNKSPPPKTVLIKGMKVTMKFCDTCEIFRPPRASHCHICDSCIDQFDHHCPWVGNCIGKRNYRWYLLFITCTAVTAFYCAGVSIARLIQLGVRSDESGAERVADALKESPQSILFILYSIFGVGTVGALAGFHFYLIARGQKTYEKIKKRFENSGNPYSGGFFYNMHYAFCPPMWPSFIVNRDGKASKAKDTEMVPMGKSKPPLPTATTNQVTSISQVAVAVQ